MLRRPEPGSFEHLVRTVSVPIAELGRLSGNPASEPYWARSAGHRFDDPLPAASKRFGVLYAAQDLETAFSESVIHECSLHAGGRYVVPRSELERRAVVRFGHPRRSRLVLADMTGDALKAMGLNNDLSAGDDYLISQQWSRALFEAKPRLAGIRYLSRQRNDAYCYAVFERSGLVCGTSSLLTLGQKARLCRRFNVDVV